VLQPRDLLLSCLACVKDMCRLYQSKSNPEVVQHEYVRDTCELAACRVTKVDLPSTPLHRRYFQDTHDLVRCKTARAAAAYLDPGPGTASRLCQYAELSLCGCASAAMRASMLLLGPEMASEKALLMLLSLRPLMGRELKA